MFTSGNHVAAVADTAEPLTARDVGFPFTYGYLSLSPAASGPAYWGGSNVKVSTAVGALLMPGDTVPVYATGAAEPHHTADIYVAFTAADPAKDIVSWTIHRG